LIHDRASGLGAESDLDGRYTMELRLKAAMLVLILASAATAACGGSDGDTALAPVDETARTFTPIAGTESAYCDTYRAWQVHELEGDGDDPAISGNPATFEKYWSEYLAFNKTALAQAPAEIRDEWVLSERMVRTTLSPVLEKYDFDVERMAREATPAEKSLGEPPPDVQKAQAAIHAYEARVCGTELPPAADVDFEAGAASQQYCKAAGTTQSEFDKIASSGFDPDLLRTFVTSDRFTELLDAQVAAAPDEIAADVKAESEWLRTRWSDVFEKFDYDIRGVWLDGTPEDRAVVHEYHPDVVEHNTRITAYEEQVCGA
jgi:hypothetical protein